MAKPTDKRPTAAAREARLAAALRENLRKRKAQARAQVAAAERPQGDAGTAPADKEPGAS